MKQVIILAIVLFFALDAHAQTVSITSYSSAAAPQLVLCEHEGDTVFIAWQSELRHQQVFFRYSEQEDWHGGSVSPISMYYSSEIPAKSAAILYFRICSGSTELQECVEGSVKISSTDSVDAGLPHHHPSW